jgi:hypothetical protein
MTLKQYREKLNKLAEENPEADNMQVIYSRDDEGNGYSNIHYSPGLGKFEHGEYMDKDNLEDGDKSNAVCIN